MISFIFKIGFYHIYRDGVEIGHCGGSLKATCLAMGGDVLAAYLVAFPPQKKASDVAIRRKFFRKGSMQLGGW